MSPVHVKGLAVLSQRTYEVTYTKYLPPTLKQPLINKCRLYGVFRNRQMQELLGKLESQDGEEKFKGKLLFTLFPPVSLDDRWKRHG